MKKMMKDMMKRKVNEIFIEEKKELIRRRNRLVLAWLIILVIAIIAIVLVMTKIIPFIFIFFVVGLIFIIPIFILIKYRR